MNQKGKRIIISVIVVAIIGAIGVGVYVGLQRATLTISEGGQKNNSVLPITSSGYQGGGGATQENDITEKDLLEFYENQKKRLSIVSDKNIVGYWFSKQSPTSTPILWYATKNVDIFSGTGTSTHQVVLSLANQTAQSVIGALGKPYAVITLENGQKVLFDGVKKTWEWLSPDVISVAFSPDGTQIALLSKTSASEKTIYIRQSPAGSKKPTPITTLAIQDVNIIWGAKDVITLAPRSSYKTEASIVQFNIKNKTASVLDSGNGIQVIWDTNGTRAMLFKSNNGRSMQVRIIDTIGTSIVDAAFSTIKEKCAFGENALVWCAIPYAASKEGTVMWPDDINKRATYTKDTVVRLDVEKKSVDTILDSGETMLDVYAIQHVGNNLYFINRYDDRLYQYSLE
ncbi:MAG: hypothetical protein KBC26_01915 [Candidatus Pacebacteria bacterium]|nr:hypothetical protein [Candidatus Paceibacterota bacterium]